MLHRVDRPFQLTPMDRLLIQTMGASVVGVGFVRTLIDARKYFFPFQPLSFSQCMKGRNIQTAADAKQWIAYCKAPQIERLDEIDLAFQVIQNFNILIGSAALVTFLFRIYHRLY